MRQVCVGDLLLKDLALFNLGGLTNAVAEVVKLSTTHTAKALGLNL